MSGISLSTPSQTELSPEGTPPAETSALAKIFTAYGFPTPEQHLDLLRLLYLSGCMNPKQLQDDLGVAGFDKLKINAIVNISNQAVKEKSVVKNLETFNPALVLSKAFITSEDNTIEIEKIHNWLIRGTQREFFARNPGEERWHQKTGQWMLDYQDEIRSIIARLGLESGIRPREKKYDAMAVFGASAPEIRRRLIYAKELVDEKGIIFNHLYLLGGERLADKAADGGEEYLLTVASKHQVARDKVTETHLMQEVYNTVKGESKFAFLPCTVIDTPKENKPRPTTIDALVKLSEKIDSDVETILFISRAPNIRAQEEDTWTVLQERFPQIKKSEVIGDSCEGVPLNRIMGAFAGTLFGGYPRVARLLGSTQSPGELKDKTTKLSFVPSQVLAKPIESKPNLPEPPPQGSLNPEKKASSTEQPSSLSPLSFAAADRDRVSASSLLPPLGQAQSGSQERLPTTQECNFSLPTNGM